MRKRVVMFAAAALLVAATPYFGGWAVTTVHDLPTHLVVGQETTLRFSVRQHGEALISGLSPVLVVKRADAGLLTRATRIAARSTTRAGIYSVAFTPSEAGDVYLTIDAGWPQKLELRPMPVLASGTSPRVATAAGEERGRALFVAAGCNTCHVKADDASLLEADDVIQIGPALTGRTWPAEFIVKKVLDPRSVPVAAGQRSRMPQLEVSTENATLIAAYLNSRQVADNR
jgi:hypothetical protein